MFQHRQDVRSLEFALKMYNCLLTIFQTHANLPSYIFGQPKKSNKSRGAKTHHFGFNEMWGRGGPDIPFILSKIVAIQ